MIVLSVIGIIAGLILTYLFVSYVNAYSTKTYGYEIFNGVNFIILVLGYLEIAFFAETKPVNNIND